MNSHSVAILGATGYSGRELVHRVLQHPRLQLKLAACRQDAGKTLDQVLAGAPPQPLVALDDVKLEDIDTVFLCLPHGASAEWAERALRLGCRVIDLSADFRLKDARVYRDVYGLEHPAPKYLAQAVYGLTELHRKELRGKVLIANPGCYPTSILLALAPLLQKGALRGTVIADSKSGVSGAGRSASLTNLYGEVAENLRPYQVGDRHRHRSEILQQIRCYGGDSQLVFVPQVVPCFRGMLTNVYVDMPELEVEEVYREFYRDEPFVKILDECATMAHTRNSNRCALSLHPLPEQGKLLVISSLDNLVKGAAGQALQNLNAAMGWPETEGLLSCGC